MGCRTFFHECRSPRSSRVHTVPFAAADDFEINLSQTHQWHYEIIYALQKNKTKQTQETLPNEPDVTLTRQLSSVAWLLGSCNTVQRRGESRTLWKVTVYRCFRDLDMVKLYSHAKEGHRTKHQALFLNMAEGLLNNEKCISINLAICLQE